jgi:uncharacterized membrane protein YfcA
MSKAPGAKVPPVPALAEACGVIGAQVGARLTSYVSTGSFKKIFAGILVGLAAYLFFQK